MSLADIDTQVRLFESLPRRIQSALIGYANAAKLPPFAVVEFTLIYFLDLYAIANHQQAESDTLTDGDSILAALPSYIREAIADYSERNKMPNEFVVELAIAHFLDPDSVTFDDCQVGLQRERIDQLVSHYGAQPISVA